MPSLVLSGPLSLVLFGPVGGTAAAAGSGSWTMLVIWITLAIGVSFLCSILEAVLLSVTPAYVGSVAEQKPRLAERLKEYKADVERPLAAILTLNTFAHTIGAAGAGAEAAGLFGNDLITVFSVILTIGILVLSEIIPKTLGAVFWRGLTPFAAAVLRPLIWITYPAVLLSQGLTKLLARGHKEGGVSREEVAAMARLGQEQGTFDASEGRMLDSLFRFRDLAARDVMTPRTVVVRYPAATPVREIADADEPFSRLPLTGAGGVDDMTTYVLRDDVLRAVAEGRGDAPASELARELPAVAAEMPLPALFEALLERKAHLAAVVGEYGGFQGVVSVEDVVETLLGLEIVDEVDRERDMQAKARALAERRRAGLATGPEAAAAGAPTERDAIIQTGLTGGVPPEA